MINKMIVSSPKNTPNTSKGIGCEITKKTANITLSFSRFFLVLTFLKRGIYTLVKILFSTFSVALRRHPSFLSVFLFCY